MKTKLLVILLSGLFFFSCKENVLQEQNIDDFLGVNDSLYNCMVMDTGFITLCDLSHGLDTLSFYPALDNYEQSKEALGAFYTLVSKYTMVHEIEDLFVYIEKYNQKYSKPVLSRADCTLEEVLIFQRNEIVEAWGELWREYESMESGLIGSYDLNCVREKFARNISRGTDPAVNTAMKYIVTGHGMDWRSYVAIEELRDLFVVKSGMSPGNLYTTLNMMRSESRAFWASGEIDLCRSTGGESGDQPIPGGGGSSTGELTPAQKAAKLELLKNEYGFDVDAVSLDPLYELCALNEQELNLVLRFPFDAIKIRDNAKFVMEVVNSIFQINGHNDVSDAFRHCYFAALNSLTCGTVIATYFGDAHEAEPNQPKIEKTMDLYNNNVGYDIIKNDKDTKLVTKENLAGYVLDALDKGKLKYIRDGKLVFSNE